MSYDVSATMAELLSRLGAASFADLPWCTQTEIYGWFNEAGLRLANLGLFVDITIVPGVTSPLILGNWLETMHCSFGGTKLRASGVSELKAMDPAWQTTTCTTGTIPSRYTLDTSSLGVMTLYPKPFDATGELEHISAIMPPLVTSSNTLLPIPSVLSDYFLYFGLFKARGKESDYSMPEVASYALQRVEMIEQIIGAYWGA